MANLQQMNCRRWDYVEITRKAEFSGNPFMDVLYSCIFTKGEVTIEAEGFYDGNKQWKIRFMPPEEGEWSYVTRSSLHDLDAHTGVVICSEAAKGVHGPVVVRDEHSFSYADGSAYTPVGTTCYVWNHQGGDLEDKTLSTLKASPFNKLRFCVFPKRYTFNMNEPEYYPFPGSVKEPWNQNNLDDYSPKKRDFWDTDYFVPEYFQHLDHCVLELMDLGIEADLILFHPYDFGAWGFDALPEEVNTRLLRYVVARLSAFRNIWWAFANEYDLFQNKAIHEWDRYMKFVQKTDPYNHLRSIHNCKDFFDHTKPWISHCSIQADDFTKIPEWENQYRKPLVIDECCYEGDINRDWGNISGKEMTHRFWQGFSSGAYVGHGETYMNEEEVLWWSKGGELHGSSPSRIAFLRDIIESRPENSRRFDAGEAFMPKPGKATGCGIFPEYGLFYFGVYRPSFRWIDLPEEGQWEIEVIDTWDLTVQSAGKTFSGHCRVELPAKEGVAIRITRQ